MHLKKYDYNWTNKNTIFLKKNSNKIAISKSNFVFHLEGESKNFEVSLEEIENTFMGFKKFSCFFLFS